MNNFYLGCDVSKGYADFIIINEEKKIVLENFQLDDTFKGHKQLHSVITEFAIEHPGCIIYSAVESTGGYENNWFNSFWELLKKVDISVARINPIGTNHNSKASMDRITTDKTAAKNIAEYLINHKKKIIYRKNDEFYSLRKQWGFVKMLTKQRTQLYNQLEKVLYIANPEVLQYCRNSYPRWLLKVLLRYPTAKLLSKARITALSSIRYLKEQKAISLINKAKNSVASANDMITSELVKSMVKEILRLSKLIKEQSKLIADSCNLPEIELLKSFIGISDYSAVGLMLEIVSIEYFSSAKKLTSFFGIHPIYKQSGDGTWGMHMSKHGRKEVRCILYNVARCAIVHNPLIKDLYSHHLKKGMNKTAAIGACMHKVLRIIYGMLKNNEEFNPEKDRANSDKMLKDQNQIKTINKKLRRYQLPDSDAPISNRQDKKRKEQDMSQNDALSLKTGSASRSSRD